MEKQDIAIVLDFKTYLRTMKIQKFTLSQLVEHIYAMPFKSYKKTKEEITLLIKNDFANINKPLAYIVPKRFYLDKTSDASTSYIFLEDYIRASVAKKSVLNATRLGKYFPTNLPVFHNKEYTSFYFSPYC